jgi:hypothetical protein
MMSDDQKELILANLGDLHDFYIDPTCRGGTCSHYCQVMSGSTWSAWMVLSVTEIRCISEALGKELPAHFRSPPRRGVVKTASPTLRERRSMGALRIDTQPY